jgi:hypothetical protein
MFRQVLQEIQAVVEQLRFHQVVQLVSTTFLAQLQNSHLLHG